MQGLRALTLKGGAFTAVRQVVGMAISFGGLAALVHLIGPATYGVYISAFALNMYAQIVMALGIDVFLVRKPEKPEPDDLHQGFTLALASGGVGVALGFAGGPLAEAWIGTGNFAWTVAALFACLPVQLAAQVPSAVLQRRMDWKAVAQAELSGLVAFQAAALGMAGLGYGREAPVAGFWAQQSVTLALLLWRSGYRPRLRWSMARLKPMLAYGAPYAAATWMWHLRGLINPLVVARMLGPEAAAVVGITVRIAESLSFMRMVAWRVSIPALARLQGEPAQLAGAISEGMKMQLAVTGPAMLAFQLAAPWFVPLAFGRSLSDMVGLFPFVATGYLANCLFGLHFATLHVTARNLEVAAVHLLHAALLMATAQLLAPRLGIAAYGWAELVAISAYGPLHAMVLWRVGRVAVALGLAWAVACAFALFAGTLGPWAWAVPAAVLMAPPTRRALGAWWVELTTLIKGAKP